ncbi:MAG: sodium:solute symporter [Chitinophagales bacterium]|nr:sodium:solute symporter [Chitinophagales bacterium]
MSTADWLVLAGTLLSIVIYGVYRNRQQKNLDAYLLGNKSLNWWRVGFSVMATQASAITFLSAPGLAYTDGMRFVQFYFGLPLAMIFICVFFLPIYHRLKVYTAYEYLESRFDLKTRSLTALLFLTQRGLAAGITIYAPSIVLSSLLGWNIYWTNLFMGGLVILYTVSGGSKAVSLTQLQQLFVIFTGMFVAGYMAVKLLPDDTGFTDALMVAGSMGKTHVITTGFDWNDRYNIWSGLIGGFFLALSYFGTDQSQVGRYLSGKSLGEMRSGLLMNGMLKIPMQFLILLIGALVFAFYQFHPAPVFFNNRELQKVRTSDQAAAFSEIEKQQQQLSVLREEKSHELIRAIHEGDEQLEKTAKEDLKQLDAKGKQLRTDAIAIIKKSNPAADTNDTNYIFLNFVLEYLPHGLIGLLIALVFCASWNSTTAELSSLASTTVVDIYKRSLNRSASDGHYVFASRVATVIWGFFAIAVAMIANQLGSLIEAVNILGSLFYGTILGVFLTAFFLKRVSGHAVFAAAIFSELIIILLYFSNAVAFLWLNMIGCALVMFTSLLLSFYSGTSRK